MWTVFQTVAPVFGLIAIGYLVGRTGFVSEAAARGLPEFVFKVAMPLMLMRTVGAARLPDVPAASILLTFFGAAAVTWVVAALLTRVVLGRGQADGSGIAMGSTFSNSVMMGIPLVLSAFGPEAGAVVALVVAFDTPIFWTWATLHLAAGEGNAGRSLAGLFGSLVARLATNPIIVGCVAGLLLQVTGATLPPLIDKMVTLIAQAAVPGALCALGLSLVSAELKGQAATVAVITLLKLLVMPAAAWAIGHALGLPPLPAAVLVVLAAMPVGANAFLFASSYNRAEASVSGAIALSTPLSMITVSAVLLLLSGR